MWPRQSRGHNRSETWEEGERMEINMTVNANVGTATTRRTLRELSPSIYSGPVRYFTRQKDNRAVTKHNHSEGPIVLPHAYSFSTSRYPSATFGECIRKARLEKGLTQTGVAAAACVNATTIGHWERYPTVPMRHHGKIRALCGFLDLDYLVISALFSWSSALWSCRAIVT